MGRGTSKAGGGSSAPGGGSGSNSATGNKQPKMSTGSGSSYVLGSIAQKMLEQGNTFTFANEFLMAYPDLAGANNFGAPEVVNSYKAFIDYDDGIYTFRGRNGTKYFFDTKMRSRGAKQ